MTFRNGVCMSPPQSNERIFFLLEQSIKMFTTNGTFLLFSSKCKNFLFFSFRLRVRKKGGETGEFSTTLFSCDDFDAKQKGENLFILYQARSIYRHWSRLYSHLQCCNVENERYFEKLKKMQYINTYMLCDE